MGLDVNNKSDRNPERWSVKQTEKWRWLDDLEPNSGGSAVSMMPSCWDAYSNTFDTLEQREVMSTNEDVAVGGIFWQNRASHWGTLVGWESITYLREKTLLANSCKFKKCLEANREKKKLQINSHTIYFNFETSRLFRTTQRKWFWICIPRLVMDKRTVSTLCSLLSRGSASDNWNKEVDSLKLLQKNFQLVGPANTSCCMFKSHQNHAESVLTMHITICLQIVSQIPLGCLLQEIALQSVSIAVHFIDGAMLSKAKHAMGGAV